LERLPDWNSSAAGEPNSVTITHIASRRTTVSSTESFTTDLANLVGSWVLDPSQTVIEFHTKAMWIVKVKGTAKALEGTGVVGEDGNVSGTLVIDAASIDTNNKKRDAHLRTNDFFEVARYPTLAFTVTSGHVTSPGHVELAGTMVIHGQSRPLTIQAEVTTELDAVTVSSEFPIDRSAWGVTWAKMGAGVANQVVVRAHFTRG
jgi:polyisoprenoid-binding protein YceI